jgi:protein involved in polysaccharide export with SLBB domain/capsular polysaccharide biosynthesis protein
MNDRNNLETLAGERPYESNGNGHNGWNHHTHAENGRMKDRPTAGSSPGHSHPPAGPAPINAWCVAEILMHRWYWLLLSGCALAGLAAAAGLWHWKKTYTAVAQLMRYEPIATGDFLKPQPVTQDTFANLMKSPDLLKRVAAQFNPPVSQEMLSKSVLIKTDPDSDVVKVGVKGMNPQAIVDAANLYAHEAVLYSLDLQRHEAERVYKDYLKQEVTHMDAQLKSLEDEFKQMPQSPFLAGKLRQVSGAVTNLARELQSPVRPSASATRINEKLQAAMDKLGEYNRLYTDAHPLVQQQRSYVEDLQHQLAQAASNPQPSTQGGYDVPLSSGPGAVNPEYDIIRGKLQALDNSRQVLADREQEAQAFAANPPGNVRFFSPATLQDVRPDRRWLKVTLISIIGGLFGMAFAGACVFLAEIMDNRLKTVEDVQRVTKLPVIATLGDLNGRKATVREKWAFRTWTMLQGRLSPSANHGLICGITSSQKGEGRTTWIHLLAEAAGMAGFRVLTIATRQPGEGADGTPQIENSSEVEDDHPVAKDLLTINALARPAEVTERLDGPNPQPSVHIPLPGWVWNLERRKQWQEALAEWRKVDNLVILVELPPASIPEAVLLGENIPNLVWLTGSGQADAAETRAQLETLRHARCHLVGAVLNREPGGTLKNRFPRWMSCVALGVGLGIGGSAFGADTNSVTTPPISIYASAAAREELSSPHVAQSPPETAAEPASRSFSIVSPANRGDWQKRLTLGPGDILSFYLYGQPELSHADVFVGPDGRVGFLEAQNVMAAGLTVDELRTNMDQELGKYRRAPHTIVMPVAWHSKKYVMLGMVAQRGVYTLDRPITVLEAVARAHGLETGISDRDTVEMADFQRSFLMRGGKRYSLDFEKLFEHGDLSQNIAVEPGDYIYFPPSNLQQVYVLGEVRAPGSVAYTRELTVVGALTSRGGFTDAAYKTHVVVIRGSFNHPKTYVVNTWAVFDARGVDFKLEPKDIIYVSGRPFLRAEQLLDLAAQSFIQSVTAAWAGKYIGPLIHPGSIPGPP